MSDTCPIHARYVLDTYSIHARYSFDSCRSDTYPIRTRYVTDTCPIHVRYKTVQHVTSHLGIVLLVNSRLLQLQLLLLLLFFPAYFLPARPLLPWAPGTAAGTGAGVSPRRAGCCCWWLLRVAHKVEVWEWMILRIREVLRTEMDGSDRLLACWNTQLPTCIHFQQVHTNRNALVWLHISIGFIMPEAGILATTQQSYVGRYGQRYGGLLQVTDYGVRSPVTRSVTETSVTHHHVCM